MFIYINLKLREDKKHDFSIFEAQFNRLYEENNYFTREINDTIKFCLSNENYFKKYEIIKKTAERSYNLKKNLLNEMKVFDKIRAEKSETELNEKRKKYCELEIEVNNIKDEILKYQKEIENFHSEIKLKERLIWENEDKNERIKTDISNYYLQFYSDKIKLLQIYENFEAFNLETIIKKFKEERIQYQGYCSIVKFYFIFIFI